MMASQGSEQRIRSQVISPSILQPISSWSEVQQAMKTVVVSHNVKRFISNIKQSIVKETVPKKVMVALEEKSYQWEDHSKMGWSPWRADVLLVDIITTILNVAAIFLLTTKIVLPQVETGKFPLIYIGTLALSCFYRLNTQVLVMHKILTNKTQIRNHYIRFQFLIDLALVILCTLEYLHYNTGAFRLLVYLKLFDLKMHLIDNYGVAIRHSRTKHIIWKLISIFAVNLLVAHTISLIVIGMTGKDSEHSWMKNKGVTRDDTNWSNCYIWAFYWSTTIMLTIGFGDITPANPRQALITAFVEMLSVFILAYCISSVGELLGTLRQSELEKHQKLLAVNRFMHKNKVSAEVQSEVKAAVAKMSNQSKAMQAASEDRVINMLMPKVREKLMVTVHYSALASMAMWNRLSAPFVKKMAVQLERRIYYSSEAIVTRGETPQQLSILKEGKLYSSIKSGAASQTRIFLLEQAVSRKNKKFQWVLLDETIKRSPSQLTIRSKGQTTILHIELQKAIRMLSASPDDYEAFCFFRDVLIEDSPEVCQYQCDVCQKPGHSTFVCPYMHYRPKRSMVLARYRKKQSAAMSKTQPHSSIPRKARNKLRWLRGMKEQLEPIDLRRRLSVHSRVSFVEFRKEGEIGLTDVLTTLPHVDEVHEWRHYRSNFNLSSLVKL